MYFTLMEQVCGFSEKKNRQTISYTQTFESIGNFVVDISSGAQYRSCLGDKTDLDFVEVGNRSGASRLNKYLCYKT